MPSFRQLSAARVGVQPAAELRHLQRHKHVVHVLRTLLPVPYPESAVQPSRARCLRAVTRRLSRLQARTSPRIVCPLFISTWQHAVAFNQPLSLDTSSVMTMKGMFGVPSARALAPSLQLYFNWALPVPCPLHDACAAVARHLPPPGLARTSPRIVCPLFISTWQQAVAFNQPLSLDTHSVMTMESMFSVPSARALALGLQLGPLRARRLRHTVAPTPSPPPDPHLTPLRMPCI